MATTAPPCAIDKRKCRDGGVEDEESPSLMYMMLPQLVRRSVPRVRSIRRSISGYSTSFGHARTSSIDGPDAGTRTPPPAYSEPLAPLTSALSDGEDGLPSGSDESKIRWKYASQGLSLLTLSAQESSCLSSNEPFSRQLYTDSMTYLLRGLPTDLSDEEQLRLRAAMPNQLAQPQPAVGALVLRDNDRELRQSSPEYEPTVLHRVVAVTVLQAFLVFSFLWLYVQTLLRSAYQYERSHHISERIVSQTTSAANALSKGTVAVCSWNDGQVGKVLEDAALWWVQSVTGGFCQGVEDGLDAMGSKSSNTRRRRRPRA
ncbi:hypothetical protein MBLNU459_g8499t1 [Dothideomycetes sp. NU459]